MLNKDEIYQTWAPAEAPWSRWVKPVLFAFMDGMFAASPVASMDLKAGWVPQPGSAAIIVNLPGRESVLWGVQLARSGYRSVPLYNGLPFPPNEKMSQPASRVVSTVDVEAILAALYGETPTLREILISAEAPPAFLLDSNRRNARVKPVAGTFDNRSICFPTDFPSAEFLLARGIGKAIIVQREAGFPGDLLQALLPWQKAGISLLRKNPDDDGPAISVVVKPPSIFQAFWYHIKVAFSTRRGELGGFGGIVPSAGG